MAAALLPAFPCRPTKQLVIFVLVGVTCGQKGIANKNRIGLRPPLGRRKMPSHRNIACRQTTLVNAIDRDDHRSIERDGRAGRRLITCLALAFVQEFGPARLGDRWPSINRRSD
jgi:hypothetical protein